MPGISKSLRILIVGGGGREHALYWKLSQSLFAEEVYVMPGNAGIPEFARIRDVNAGTFSAVQEVLRVYKIDMVVVGPEQPLVDGLGDYLAEMAPEVLFFGPSQDAAWLEGSKAYCKRICTSYGIPTAEYQVADDLTYATQVLTMWGAPVVIKADGLCAGKGVVIANTLSEACDAARSMLVDKRLGKAGETIVIERKLEGKECSVMALCDGTNIMAMPAARDHKRLRSGPEGPDNPNTGGMGAYSPVPDVDEKIQERIRVEILEPLVKAMRTEGRPYKGVIFAGIMVTDKGPMLLEVNCRFGDPETQTILPRLESDLLPYLIAVCTGTLDLIESLEWSSKYSVCVNRVSGGYPGKYETGLEIEGLYAASQYFHAIVFHAGTELKNNKFVTAGGRVLSFVGDGRNMREAADNAYDAANLVRWKGSYLRSDIGRYKA